MEGFIEENSHCTSVKIKSFLNEVMRFYPPGYIFNREVKNNFIDFGFNFKAKTQLFLVPYLAHRNPGNFNEPLSFKWDRFTSGVNFSLFIGEFIIRHLIKNYTIKHTSNCSITPKPLLSLSPGPFFECFF